MVHTLHLGSPTQEEARRRWYWQEEVGLQEEEPPKQLTATTAQGTPSSLKCLLSIF